MIVVDLETVAEQLRAAETELVKVGLARDLGAAKADTLAFPSAMVIPLAERSGPQRYMGQAPLSQEVRFTFGVVLALRDIGGRSGGHTMGEVPRHREQVMRALATYRYPGADDVCLPVSGRLVSGIDRQGRLLWQDDYAILFHRRIDGVTP
jgi:hypothetical protein